MLFNYRYRGDEEMLSATASSKELQKIMNIKQRKTRELEEEKSKMLNVGAKNVTGFKQLLKKRFGRRKEFVLLLCLAWLSSGFPQCQVRAANV